jgi:hypothetical protein
MATEDELRGRYAEAAADWAYMHPISNGGLAEGDEAVRLATTWGEQIARYLTDAVRDEVMERARGEIGRLGNRVRALEANGAELLARAEAAEAERDALRARLTGAAIHALRLKKRIAPGTEAWSVLGELRAALTAVTSSLPPHPATPPGHH